MGRDGWRAMGRGAVLCVAPLVFMLTVVWAGEAAAGVAGSKHDFTGLTGLNKGGVCSPCHNPHYASDAFGIWPRDLSQERTYFNQVSNPKYVTDFSVICYDCHDNHSLTVVDDDPPDASFNSSRKPQDVAFDLDMRNPPPANDPNRDGSATDNIPGYYENKPSRTVPPTTTTISGHYFKNAPGGTTFAAGDKLPCRDCHDPHDTTYTAFIRKYLAGTTLPPRGVNPTRASTNMSYDTYPTVNTNTRDDQESRDFCIHCHGTSEQVTYKAVKFSDIGAAYVSSTLIVKPTVNVLAHKDGQTTACTECHYHNRIVANCNECHGFPPLLTETEGGGAFDPNHATRKFVENYTNGAGAHRRHLDALGAAIFDCTICHGPEPGTASWHNGGAGTFSATNVDIIGKSAWWDPDNTRAAGATGYVGNTSTETLPAGYEFVAKGGGNQRCFGLACHGDPPNTADALNWTDNMLQDGGETATFDITICVWCHDSTPAALDKDGEGTTYGLVKAPNIMGAGSGNGAWGAGVNGHGLASGNYDANTVGGGGGLGAANKGCAVCHDATYTPGTITAGAYTPGGPDKAHFDGAYDSAEKRLNDSINGKNLLADIVNATPSPNDTVRDAACVACHQYTGTDQGLQVSTHGNHFNGSVELAFQRECRSCHEPHGRNWNGAVVNGGTNGRNLHMVGTWLDSPTTGTWGATDAGEEARIDSDATGATPAVAITTADAKVVLTAASGDNSYDDGYNDSLHESVCVVCHRTADRTPAGIAAHGTENTVESTSLQGGTTHNPVGGDCTTCHPHGTSGAEAFKPAGCFGCHGTKTAGETPPGVQGTDWFPGQFWPDGAAALPQYTYADNQPGAHVKHVQTIAAKVFGETPAQLVTNATAQNPGLVSATKQVVVCGFCHANPGGAGHHLDGSAAPSGTGRVDVFQGTAAGDYFDKFTPGTHATYGRTNFGDDTTGGAYTYATEVCANLVCHNQAASPASPTGWNAPPTWTVTAKCDNTSCHGAGTYVTPGTTNVHNTHVGATGRGYVCTECHVANTSMQHQNASVNMTGTGTPAGVWNSPGTLEGTIGGGNGYYDKDGSLSASAGDANFAYKNGTYNVVCYRIYCHGADNTAAVPPDWGGGDTTPVWNKSEVAPLGVYCGSCHDGNGTGTGFTGGTDVIATGNHTTHLNGTLAYGPRFGNTGCVGNATIGCHPSHAVTSASHVDGTVNFLNLDGATVANFAATTTCDECHGASTTNAKTPANWSSGSYKIPCLECHDAANPANSARTGVGVVASPKSAYWTSAGHGSTGTYTPSGRAGAAAICANCHNAASAHIDGTLGTTDRLTTAGNALCNGCHDGPGAGSAVTQVSTHANGTYTPANAFKARQRAPFQLNCVECHDVHGTSNIYMVNTVNTNGPLVLPRQYGGADNTTTFLMHDSGSVAFTDHSVGTSGTSGVGFADTAALGNATKICQTCHTLTGHYQYNSNDAHFVSVCTACHPHEFDADNTTLDGFMPKGNCEDCHNGSAAANGAPNVMTYWAGSNPTAQDGGHGDPGGLAAVECTGCHDIGVPTSPASAGHDGTGGGTYNSLWYPNATTRSTNTSHLKAEFFTKYPAGGAGDWSVQVAFDNYCTWECHDPSKNDTGPVKVMRHEPVPGSPRVPTDPDYFAVKFGNAFTPPAPPNNIPDNLVIPIDVDLNTNASPTGDYAPCISCHDPHGTGVKVPSGYSSNRMMRYEFPVEIDPTMRAELCAKCHR